MIFGPNFLVLGRVGMDIYPEARGKISAGGVMRGELGGSSGNIAAGIVRLDGRAQMLTLLPDDPIGRFVRAECARYGIGTRYLGVAPMGSYTSLAFAENRLDDFETVIYRASAADLFLDMKAIEKVDFAEFDALVLTATALSAEPSLGASMEAMRRAKYSILDLDYRPTAWVDKDPGPVYQSAIEEADFVVGNDEEFALIGGLERAREIGRERVAIYKMGPKGAITIARGAEFETPIFEVEAMKPIGAGDAFMAGLLMGVADGLSLERAVEQGAANAAIVVSRPACAPSLATREEIEKFIEQRMS